MQNKCEMLPRERPLFWRAQHAQYHAHSHIYTRTPAVASHSIPYSTNTSGPAERDHLALTAQRSRARVQPIARSALRTAIRYAQLAQRRRSRRTRRWKLSAQARSTAPVSGVSCGMLAEGRGWRTKEGRTLLHKRISDAYSSSHCLERAALTQWHGRAHHPTSTQHHIECHVALRQLPTNSSTPSGIQEGPDPSLGWRT
jgi:hypothetical protein